MKNISAFPYAITFPEVQIFAVAPRPPPHLVGRAITENIKNNEPPCRRMSATPSEKSWLHHCNIVRLNHQTLLQMLKQMLGQLQKYPKTSSNIPSSIYDVQQFIHSLKGKCNRTDICVESYPDLQIFFIKLNILRLRSERTNNSSLKNVCINLRTKKNNV